MSVDELDQLQIAFNQALDTIRVEMSRNVLPPFSSDASHRHPTDEPSYMPSPELYKARRIALGTSSRTADLKNILQPPFEKVVEQSFSVYDTACLDIFVKAGVVDHLAHADHSKGLDVAIVGDNLQLDQSKLVVVLKYLACRGWVRQTSDTQFALARPALELLPGRNGRKWAMTPGKPAIAQALLSQVTHNTWRFSWRPDQTAFQIAYNTPLTLFAWMQERPIDFAQWSSSVEAIGDVYGMATLRDVPWKKFSGSTFVDCAGGKGNLSIALADILPDSTFLVQDLPEVIPSALHNIEQHALRALQDGRIGIEAVNLFDEQPRGGDNVVYLLRHVLHDWPKNECVHNFKNRPVSILKNISTPASDTVSRTRSTALTRSDLSNGIMLSPNINPTSSTPENLSVPPNIVFAMGVHLMGVLNAQERTLDEMHEIITMGGLEVHRVYRTRGIDCVIECRQGSPASSQGLDFSLTWGRV
ncbi:hypothetical protein K488DRAFT_80771 [Vararia minispora EC-137]|uniref:Uncharacterized protein n=1 Tax=Vararia minispora EC-137 TaxID=1314806 RepID=A0ACB8Q907_9AGAM|nr:hypothetical protein K488DRAFT_80771 [Vararia minispora EC-137]